MMVERRSPIGLLQEDFKKVTSKLEKINQEGHRSLTSSEIHELTQVMHRVNTTLNKAPLEHKTQVKEEMDINLEKVLLALQLFQTNQFSKSKSKNLDQAIASILATLKEEASALQDNLKNLKEFKIGTKVVKSQQSRQLE